MRRDNDLLRMIDEADDDLDPARGMVYGTAVAIVLWTIGGLVGLWLAGGV